MIPVSDTLAQYAASNCSGADFLAVFRWLFIDRETRLPDGVKPLAEIIARDQDELMKHRARKIEFFQALKKRLAAEAGA